MVNRVLSCNGSGVHKNKGVKTFMREVREDWFIERLWYLIKGDNN